MGDISNLITFGKYADSKVTKNHTGNLMTDYYYESVANVKKRVVHFSDMIGTHPDGEWYKVIPPVLLPSGLIVEDLLFMTVHYTDMFDSGPQPLVSTVDEAYVKDDVYFLILSGGHGVLIYDPNTGITVIDNDEKYSNNSELMTALGLTTSDPLTDMFNKLYSIMIGNIPESETTT